MNRKDYMFFSVLAVFLCLAPSVRGAVNPDLIGPPGSPPVINDIETAYEVICDVGKIHNRISNNTVLPGGSNERTIVFGDDTALLPSMTWLEPGIYTNNFYLYFGTLRIGRDNRLLHLSTATSDTLIVSQNISDFDTDFYISEDTVYVPPQERLNLGIHQYSHAWDETDADDFIIYEFWIVNLVQNAIDSVYVALHADCDASGAGGGSGFQGFWIDDMVDYYRNDETREYISYMYDGDNPNIAGDDTGGKLNPKESRGYIGSRLLYCPPIMGSSTPSVQQGHDWWDWNSDPGWDEDWMLLMSDGLWLDPPPSPHDFRFLQKMGPFEISAGDSIRIVFAFGIGNGLQGLRSNLSTAKLLFDYNYVYQDIPPTAPGGFDSRVIGNDIEFSWIPNEEPDLAGYNIYRADDPQGPFESINPSLIDTSYFYYQKFERGLYHFYVTAVDIDGNESTPSEMQSQTLLPDPPASFRAISGNNSVSLRWNIAPGDDSYKIFRSQTSGGPYFEIAEIQYPDHQYVDNNVINFQTYYYVARTVDGWYLSPYSGEVEVVPDPSDNGRVLLVDDYAEFDDHGNYLTYQQRRRFYERWGVRNFDYDIWCIAEQGMVDSSTILNYQAVVFASDGELDNADGTWWYEIGAPGQSSVHYYMENGGRLLAIGQVILPWIWNTIPPMPGDFEYDWFGIDSTGDGWDYEWRFTWAIGAEPGYPDSMKIDVAKNGDQDDYASCVYSLRPGGDTLFTWGLWVDGYPPPPEYYQQPVGIIYRPGGVAISSLINFSLYEMPGPDVRLTMTNILRDEFGCTYYEDPPPLPPWKPEIEPLIGNRLRIIWVPSDEEDVVSTNIYRSVENYHFDRVASVDRDTGYYIDEGVTPGLTYAYRLSSSDFAGQEGTGSNQVQEIGGRPQAPDNFSLVPGSGEVQLFWEFPGDTSIVTYSIYRRHGAVGSFAQIASLPAEDSSYLDNSVMNREFYYYYMTTVSGYGVESHPSDTLFAFPLGPGGREGILIVNGVDWETYGSQVINMYEQDALTGTYDYFFWDLFETPTNINWSHPENILGWGPVPEAFFDAFHTIIWVGNRYNGDGAYWDNNRDNIMACLNSGGNIILTGRYGDEFFWDDLCTYAGVDPAGFLNYVTPAYLDAVQFDLVDLHVAYSSLSLTSLVTVVGYSAIKLFEDPYYPDYAAGFTSDSPGSSGQFVYIAGRTYRFNLNDLEQDFETILDDYLGIPLPRPTGTDPEIPTTYKLFENYPNPFNPDTKIKFGLPVQADVRLAVYDILGREVTVLIDDHLDAGYHEIVWDGKTRQGNDIASGVYFYLLETGDFSDIKKMLLLK